MQKRSVKGMNSFDYYIKHAVNPNVGNAIKLDEHHIHDTCEIYVNIRGDVSFMVENEVYPVKRGEAIITRPYEYHHCIYHSKAVHEHYWILFEPNGNEELLKPFFDRPLGKENHITFKDDGGEKLIALCERLLEADRDELSYQMDFIKMIQILNSGNTRKSGGGVAQSLLRPTLDLIDELLPEPISVEQLAQRSNVSVNTLERWFKSELDMTPKEFILRKRLGLATSILRDGGNVQQAGLDSGFNDISYFIKLFKRYYGMTPLKFVKLLRLPSA